MHNFWLVSKARLDEAFDFSRLIHADSISKRLGIILYKLIKLVIYVLIGLVLYNFYDVLAVSGIVDALPVMSYFFASAISVLGTIISINEILVGNEDSEFLLSTPVSEFTHVLIMLINVYFRSFMYVLLIEGTAGLVYMKYETSVGFLGGWILGLFITNLPLLGIACLIGTIVTLSIVHSPKRDQIQSGITIAFIVATVAIVIVMSNKVGDIVAGISVDSNMTSEIITLFVKNFRFSRIYQYGIVENQIGYAVLFPFISILWFVVYALCFAVGYRTMIVSFRCPADYKEYTWREQKQKDILLAMFKREWQKVVRSKTYMIKTMTSFAIGIVLALSTLVFGAALLMNFISKEAIIGLICLFIGIGNTTYCSYSIEGRRNYITLTAPVNDRIIILSKVAVNLVIAVPYAIICGLAYAISIRPDMGVGVLYVIVPILYAILVAIVGAVVDRRFADYSKESEEQAMHQGLSYILGFLPGVIVAIIMMVVL